MVRSEHCNMYIPELELEMPKSNKGSINTLEGFISNCKEDLAQMQPVRKIQAPELYEKIEEFIGKLDGLLSKEQLPFTFIMDDKSGNSFIKHLSTGKDEGLIIENTVRTPEELQAMGYSIENAQEGQKLINQEEKKEGEKPEGLITAHNADLTKPLTN